VHIYVHTRTGRNTVLDVDPTDRIEHVEAMIQDREGIPADIQSLTFSGALLED
jgi:hypothetical protein